MRLRYTSPFKREQGIIDWLLNESYATLVETDTDLWNTEKENWKQFDRDVFENPDSVGSCAFLSWYGKDVVGFSSFDPRQRPIYGIIGHNCILPEFRGRGFGRQQIHENLRRFEQMNIRRAKVSTNDHPFFVPAQQMYIACGFREVARIPWDRDPQQNMIHYEMGIG